MMTNNDKDIQLSRLLQIKRREIPSEQEWEAFSVAFENKKLIAMNGKNKRSALIPLAINFAKRSFLRVSSTSVVCAAALGICLLHHHDETVNDCHDHSYVKFVADKMSLSHDIPTFVTNECGDINFGTTTEYVQDILTSTSHNIMASL